MTSKLRLHYAPDNASLCVRIALEELELEYETVLVDRRAREQKSPAYLALNPNGLIPVLETPHGIMFETGAILLWLADRTGKLIPAIDNPNRAQALKWLFWIANSLQPTQRSLFYPDLISKGPPEDLKTRDRLIELLDILEASEDTVWIDSDEASVQSCFLGPMLRWCHLYGGDPSWFNLKASWPRLYNFAKKNETRPAVLRAAIAEGLGETPFSNPMPPNPPEGSPN